MGRQHQRRGTVGENQRWEKEIIVYWEGLFRKITEQLQHRWQQNRLFILKMLLPPSRELHKSDIHVRAAIAKPLVTENNAQMRKRWCHVYKTWTSDKTTKPGHQTTGNEKRACCGQMSRPSRCSLHRKVYTFWEHPRTCKIRNAWFQQWDKGEGPLWFGQQYRGTVFCWWHYYPSWPNYF
jgi:hypothetical protein